MLTLNLKEQFKLKSILQKQAYLRKFGFTRSESQTLASKYDNKRITLIQLEKLCVAFNCTPNDLLTYTPSANATIPKDHPLYLLKREPAPNIPELLQKLSPDKLKELTKQIESFGFDI